MITNYNFWLDRDYLKNEGDKGDRELGLLDSETFFITEYISKHIRKKKINCKNQELSKVKKISINFSSKENRVYPKYESSLYCDLTFKYSDIFCLRGTARTKLLMEVIAKSAEQIRAIEPDLGSEIKNVIDQFKKDSYQNIWIHKTKRLKGVGLAKLECRLSALEFILALVVEDKNGEIFRKRILNTRGDSFMYHHLFNNLDLLDDDLSILSRVSSKPIYTISLEEVRNTEAGKFPYNESVNQTMILDSEKHELVLNPKLSETTWWNDFVNCFTDDTSTSPCPDLSEFE